MACKNIFTVSAVDVQNHQSGGDSETLTRMKEDSESGIAKSRLPGPGPRDLSGSPRRSDVNMDKFGCATETRVSWLRTLPNTRPRHPKRPFFRPPSANMSVADTDWDLISSYAGLVSLACTSIYAGSYGSLSVRLLPILVRSSCSTSANTNRARARALQAHNTNTRRKRTRRSRDCRLRTLIYSQWFVASLFDSG